MKKTYDDIQLGAVLTCCLVCQRSYYATKPTPGWVCIRCRHLDAEAKQLRAATDGGRA